ncbi:MAG: hypothetical protein WDN49_20405 [Acetobacteraceae bacterium]
MPLNHVAVVLWLVAIGLLLHRTASPLPALRRARRPALAILLFVLLYGAPLLALVLRLRRRVECWIERDG